MNDNPLANLSIRFPVKHAVGLVAAVLLGFAASIGIAITGFVAGWAGAVLWTLLVSVAAFLLGTLLSPLDARFRKIVPVIAGVPSLLTCLNLNRAGDEFWAAWLIVAGMLILSMLAGAEHRLFSRRQLH